MSRVLVGVDDLSRRSFHGDLRIRIEIYITQEIIIHVFLLSIIVAGVYSRPRPIELVHVETGPVVVLLHVESAQPRTRAVKIEPVHSVELLFISLLQ